MSIANSKTIIRIWTVQFSKCYGVRPTVTVRDRKWAKDLLELIGFAGLVKIIKMVTVSSKWKLIRKRLGSDCPPAPSIFLLYKHRDWFHSLAKGKQTKLSELPDWDQQYEE